jgi:hypothetical protein
MSSGVNVKMPTGSRVERQRRGVGSRRVGGDCGGNACKTRRGTVDAMSSNLHPDSESAVICIAALVCPADTMGGLRAMLAAADRVGADDALELVDGRHAQLVEPFPGTPPEGSAELTLGSTLGDLRAFANTFRSIADDTALLNGSSICVDLPVYRLEFAGCGEHVGALPDNVLVTVNPACRDER